jgi:3-hydroxyacyl-CoA dehydrogenase
MKIIVAGTGFVGLTHAAVCSEYGHEVYAYDIDPNKLAAYRSAERARIEHYVNEPGKISGAICSSSMISNRLLRGRMSSFCACRRRPIRMVHLT